MSENMPAPAIAMTPEQAQWLANLEAISDQAQEELRRARSASDEAKQRLSDAKLMLEELTRGAPIQPDQVLNEMGVSGNGRGNSSNPWRDSRPLHEYAFFDREVLNKMCADKLKVLHRQEPDDAAETKLREPVSVANHSAVNMLLKMTSSESARSKKGNAP